jgi:hypothetical protein
VPGWPGGGTFLSFNDPVLDEVGGLVFTAVVLPGGGPTRRAVLRWNSGTFTTILAQGDAAPDTNNQVFQFPKPIAASDDGATILFHSTLASGGCPGLCPTFGYFVSDSIGLAAIVMNRVDPLPEVPSGFILERLGSAAINSLGEVIVSVELGSGSTFEATYGWTRDFGLFPVALPGTQIETDPGIFKTV